MQTFTNKRGDEYDVEISFNANAKGILRLVGRAAEGKTGVAKAGGGAVTVRIIARRVRSA